MILDCCSPCDLALFAAALMALAVFLYVLLDGFDLGIGILFPWAPSHACRDKIMNSVAPFWDGNETWLVMGGGVLFAAFPLAYAILLPAFYIPLILMLLGLIFRGVAFEFRFKSKGQLWDWAFHGGSLCAALFQGIILGAFLQGVKAEGRSFAGGSFDWLTPFSVMTGIALVVGYALLGATWTIMKTEGPTQAWARKIALRLMLVVALFLTRVCCWPLLVMAGCLFLALYLSLRRGDEVLPFWLSLSIFGVGYSGLGQGLYPWIVPYHISLWQAAAAPKSLSLILSVVVFILPVILGYTAYVYYVFRGKATEGYE